MFRGLHQADNERPKKRQEWAAKHRSPTPETTVKAPPKVGSAEIRTDKAASPRDGSGQAGAEKTLEPQAVDIQDLEGNIRSLFPSKS